MFPPLEPAGEVLAHSASMKPEGSAPAVKILHHTMICCASEAPVDPEPVLHPEPDAIDAFCKAVERGVDVRVMVPSADASDMPMVQHAAHRNFQQLLDAGVRIFEYQKTLLHQKVMTVDGVWCAIGSSNFDDRSFETNDEITLGFLDRGLARQLEEIFEREGRKGRGGGPPPPPRGPRPLPLKGGCDFPGGGKPRRPPMVTTGFIGTRPFSSYGWGGGRGFSWQCAQRNKGAAFVRFESWARRRIRVHHVARAKAPYKETCRNRGSRRVGWQHVPAMQALGQ